MTLQEYEAQGGCEGCYFYGTIDVDGNKKGEKAMANIDVMYSSKTDQWATPDDFFRELDQEFHFNLDPCADEQNHKCEKYFTKEDNGLSKDWGGIACFAILRMVERLQTGLKRHTEKGQKTTRLLLC